MPLSQDSNQFIGNNLLKITTTNIVYAGKYGKERHRVRILRKSILRRVKLWIDVTQHRFANILRQGKQNREKATKHIIIIIICVKWSF